MLKKKNFLKVVYSLGFCATILVSPINSLADSNETSKESQISSTEVGYIKDLSNQPVIDRNNIPIQPLNMVTEVAG